MKALLASGVFFALVISLAARNQTNAVSTASTTDTPKPAQHYPVTAIVSSNTVTFPVLLSNTSEPLMTNAVFHSTFGRKVIFGEDLSIRAFDVDRLHPSVLAQLNLDPDKLEADQQTLDQRYQQWLVGFNQQLQKYLSAESPSSTGDSAGLTNGVSTNSAATNAPHHIHYRYYRSSAGKHAAKPAHLN